jgi:hypothetical protein
MRGGWFPRADYKIYNTGAMMEDSRNAAWGISGWMDGWMDGRLMRYSGEIIIFLFAEKTRGLG